MTEINIYLKYDDFYTYYSHHVPRVGEYITTPKGRVVVKMVDYIIKEPVWRDDETETIVVINSKKP